MPSFVSQGQRCNSKILVLIWVFQELYLCVDIVSLNGGDIKHRYHTQSTEESHSVWFLHEILELLNILKHYVARQLSNYKSAQTSLTLKTQNITKI